MPLSPQPVPAARPARVLRSAALVGGLTAVSRVTGLLREMLMSRCFGTGVAKSAFNVAFQIPNLFRRLFGEGALSAAFVPVFTETLEREGIEAANRLTGRVAGLLVAVLGVITALGILVALALQHTVCAPDSRWAAIMPLLRIMMPYAPLICLAALSMGVLNAMRQFAVPALAPVLLNLVMIVAIVAVCPLLPNDPMLRIRVVSWSVLVAGALQVVVQLPPLARRGVKPQMLFSWRGDAALGRILKTMAPMMVGVSVVQIYVAMDGVIAMWAADWAPAVLGYAETIAYLPLGLIGNAFGTVLLPTFSRQVVANDFDAVRDTLEHALRNALIVTAPAAVALTVLALPVVEVIYLSPPGRFTHQDAIWTMRALAGLAPGLLFFSVQKVLTPVFYAFKDTRTPLRISLWGVGLNFALNILFVVTWPQGWKHVGLVVSTVIASAINSVALGHELHRRIGAPRWRAWAPTAVGVAVAMLGMGLAAFEAHVWLDAAIRQAVHVEKFVQILALAGAAGVSFAVYLLLMRLLCRRELGAVTGELLQRRRRR